MLGSNRVTLCDLLSSEYLRNLFLQELVALLADLYNLLTGDAQASNGLEDLLGDDRGTLVLCEGIRVA